MTLLHQNWKIQFSEIIIDEFKQKKERADQIQTYPWRKN